MDRTYTVDELLGAVRRRWKVMALVAGGVLALAALVIARTPNEYKARAVVMVEPFTPHPDLVVPVTNPNSLEEKVKSIRAQVYSRSVMAAAVEELKLYPKEREKSLDSAIDLLRLDTEVHPEGEDTFSIVVRSADADTAARIANRLAELVIEGNLQVRAGQVARTREIIGGKLNDLRGQLATAEAKVAAYKQAHADTLPELNEARMRQREQLAKQITDEDEFAKNAQHTLDLLGTQPYGGDTEVGRLEAEYDAMRAKLATATSSLTENNPDVQALKRETEATYARLQSARQRAEANDLTQRRMNAAIERSQKRIAQLQEKQAALDKLMDQAPQTGLALQQLTSDVEVLRAKVQQLVSKKAEADIAADLEAKSGPAEYRVLETAQPSLLPSAPNRPQMLMLALLAALALGAAVALFQELSDRSLRSEGEVADLNLPVLASVPVLPMRGNGRLLTSHPGAEV